MGKPLTGRRRERALARLLPHLELVTVEQNLGGGANGRTYGDPIVVRRAQIVDKTDLVRDQYDKEVVSATTIYLETVALPVLPSLESRVTVWAGTVYERVSHVLAVARYEHPDIADLLEVKLR